jgi:acyl dehydratase
MSMTSRSMTPAEYVRAADLELGFTRWVTVDQARIDRFAETSEDRQFIHVDPLRAAETPFGSTIAHGALVLSLLTGIAQDVLPAVEGARMGVVLGFDRIRFLQPVPSGARIRAHLTIQRVSERAPQVLQAMIAARVDIEGGEKPALVAEWLVLTYL